MLQSRHDQEIALKGTYSYKTKLYFHWCSCMDHEDYEFECLNFHFL